MVFNNNQQINVQISNVSNKSDATDSKYAKYYAGFRETEMSLLFLIISSKLKCVSFECLIHSNDQRQNNYFDMDHLNVSQILLGLNFVCYNSLNRVRCTCA